MFSFYGEVKKAHYTFWKLKQKHIRHGKIVFSWYRLAHYPLPKKILHTPLHTFMGVKYNIKKLLIMVGQLWPLSESQRFGQKKSTFLVKICFSWNIGSIKFKTWLYRKIIFILIFYSKHQKKNMYYPRHILEVISK